jgi:hypothetical protein
MKPSCPERYHPTKKRAAPGNTRNEHNHDDPSRNCRIYQNPCEPRMSETGIQEGNEEI